MRHRSMGWWSWLVTLGFHGSFLMLGWWPGLLAAVMVNSGQALVFARHENGMAVQVRVLFSMVLLAALWPPLAFMHWLQLFGIVAVLGADYCVASRLLSLMPWNRRRPLTLELVRLTFFSAPRPSSAPGRALADE